MIVEVKVPSPGESITEVEIGAWLVENGAVVEKDQEIAEVESDKATLTISASEAGKVELKAEEGETVEVGAVVCTIDTDVAPEAKEEDSGEKSTDGKKEEKDDKKEEKESKEDAEEKDSKKEESEDKKKEKTEDSKDYDQVKVTPVAKELMKEHDLSIEDVVNGLKRLGKKEVELP